MKVSYNSGRDSSEESIMSVDKAQRTNRLSFDDDGDDIAVIIGTFGALFGGILTYAGLKRGCHMIFGPKKGNKAVTIAAKKIRAFLVIG